MKDEIETRELIGLDGPGGVVRITYHRPRQGNSGVSRDLGERDRVGLLFLTGLSATRAANGDAAVYWADAFAERGYRGFRLDLPGFGDSEGDPPPEASDFINRGGYASILTDAMHKLVVRFNLSGVVLVGHCTGTVSAIYAGGSSRDCRGLILMDPLFFLPATRLSSLRRGLHGLVLQSHLNQLLTGIYDRAKEIRLLLSANPLPANANVALLRHWKKLASTGLPILILKSAHRNASGTRTRLGEFDYIHHVVELAGRKSHVAVEVAGGANHSFANRVGRMAVRQHTESWLNVNFPLLAGVDSTVSTLQSEAGGDQVKVYANGASPEPQTSSWKVG